MNFEIHFFCVGAARALVPVMLCGVVASLDWFEQHLVSYLSALSHENANLRKMALKNHVSVGRKQGSVLSSQTGVSDPVISHAFLFCTGKNYWISHLI